MCLDYRLWETDDDITPSKKRHLLLKPKIDDEEEEDLFSFASDKVAKAVSSQNIKSSDEDLFSFSDVRTSAKTIDKIPETTRKRKHSSDDNDSEKIHVNKVIKITSPLPPEKNKDVNIFNDSQDSKGFLTRKGNMLVCMSIVHFVTCLIFEFLFLFSKCKTDKIYLFFPLGFQLSNF